MKKNQTNKLFIRLLFISFYWMLFTSGIGRDDIKTIDYREFAKDSVFDCIGEVYDKKNKFILSCVLIENKFLLTSAHGFYKESKNNVIDTITVHNKRYPIKRPESSHLINLSEFYIKFKNKVFSAKKIVVHPEYNDGFNSEGYNDIAIIELEEPVTFIKPASLYTDTLEKGARGIISGFGSNYKANNNGLFPFFKRRKMAGENIIDSLGGNILNNKYGVLFADMDNPKNSKCNRIGDPLPLTLEWHGAAGDCGGGLFIIQNNQWRLAGISFAPSYFEDWELYGQKFGNYGFIDGWTRISPLVDWIKNNIDK